MVIPALPVASVEILGADFAAATTLPEASFSVKSPALLTRSSPKAVLMPLPSAEWTVVKLAIVRAESRLGLSSANTGVASPLLPGATNSTESRNAEAEPTSAVTRNTGAPSSPGTVTVCGTLSAVACSPARCRGMVSSVKQQNPGSLQRGRQSCMWQESRRGAHRCAEHCDCSQRMLHQRWSQERRFPCAALRITYVSDLSGALLRALQALQRVRVP